MIMFKEVLDLFNKLISPTAVHSKILHNTSIPLDLMDRLYMTNKLTPDPARYYKVEEIDDIVMVLYKDLYSSHKTAIIDDVMLKNGKPVLHLILDSDTMMEGSDLGVITAMLAVALNVSCFFKAKYSAFLYNRKNTIEKVIDESTIILFIAFVISTFRKSDELFDTMLTAICEIERYQSFKKNDLKQYIDTISKCGVDFLLDNSGIGAKDE